MVLRRYYRRHPKQACPSCLALFRDDTPPADPTGQVHTAIEAKPPPQPARPRAPTRDVKATMRRLRARKAAYAMHAKHGHDEVARKGLEAARRAFFERFVDQVDPRRELPEEERLQRAKAAQRAHMIDMALKSIKARQRKGRRA